MAGLENRMRLADEAVPLLRLLADGEKGDVRVGDAQDLLGEDGAHMPELDEVLRASVGIRARVDQHGRAADGRERHGDRRPVDVGEPTDLEQSSPRASRPCSLRRRRPARLLRPPRGRRRTSSFRASRAPRRRASRPSRRCRRHERSRGPRRAARGSRAGRKAQVRRFQRPRRARPRRSPPGLDRRPSRRPRPGSWSSLCPFQ